MERLTLATAERAAAPTVPGAAAALATTADRPTDTHAVRDVVRAAIDRGTRLRIVGRGTWLDAGRPVTNATPVALDGLTGIVDYTPGDLTLTARAGTTLGEIATATAANGQWLSLTPWGGDAGSLGATAATASSGPLSGALGTPRDVIIGLEAVTGAGDVVRGGGRVVKNVAGFDLTRLMIGAWGTLGVLTEISVRLRGLPERDLTVALPLPATAALGDFLTRLRSAPITPIALELVGATLARRIGAGSEGTLLARLAGNEPSVSAQREALAAMGDITEIGADVWQKLRAAEPTSSSVVRLSSSVARFADAWGAAERVAGAVSGGFAHATLQRSVARVVLPNGPNGLVTGAADALRSIARETRIFERLPASEWQAFAPSAVTDNLSRGVRDAFDPDRLLNPGILGEDLS
jgi:glycolate oxidase FAD binding subunit